jgi:hypothetical protein
MVYLTEKQKRTSRKIVILTAVLYTFFSGIINLPLSVLHLYTYGISFVICGVILLLITLLCTQSKTKAIALCISSTIIFYLSFSIIIHYQITQELLPLNPWLCQYFEDILRNKNITCEKLWVVTTWIYSNMTILLFLLCVHFYFAIQLVFAYQIELFIMQGILEYKELTPITVGTSEQPKLLKNEAF